MSDRAASVISQLASSPQHGNHLTHVHPAPEPRAGALAVLFPFMHLVIKRRLMSNMLRRVYGSSKYPWLTSFLKYVVLTGGTGVIAWYAHPYLLDELAELLKLDYKVRRV